MDIQMGNSSVVFGKNTVTKTTTPNLMKVEVEKMIRARKIGKKCGLFRVPEVLEYDKAKGIAVFERIHQLKPIANIIRETKQVASLVKQLGRSLAIIHRELALPDNMTFKLPPDFRFSGTEVFLHGDFNGFNVCIAPNTPSIVILDWQMTAQHGGRATYGSRYFDLLWFINYLIWKPTIKYLFEDLISKVTKQLFHSYFKEADLVYDAEIIERYSKNFFNKKFSVKKNQLGWKKRCLIPFNKSLTNNFYKSLHSIQI